jgi:hypothetical protein
MASVVVFVMLGAKGGERKRSEVMVEAMMVSGEKTEDRRWYAPRRWCASEAID